MWMKSTSVLYYEQTVQKTIIQPVPRVAEYQKGDRNVKQTSL